jgi:hypothetical protein
MSTSFYHDGRPVRPGDTAVPFLLVVDSNSKTAVVRGGAVRVMDATSPVISGFAVRQHSAGYSFYPDAGIVRDDTRLSVRVYHVVALASASLDADALLGLVQNAGHAGMFGFHNVAANEPGTNISLANIPGLQTSKVYDPVTTSFRDIAEGDVIRNYLLAANPETNADNVRTMASAVATQAWIVADKTSPSGLNAVSIGAVTNEAISVNNLDAIVDGGDGVASVSLFHNTVQDLATATATGPFSPTGAYNITGLDDATLYHVWVSATDGNNVSGPTLVGSATTLDSTDPVISGFDVSQTTPYTFTASAGTISDNAPGPLQACLVMAATPMTTDALETIHASVQGTAKNSSISYAVGGNAVISSIGLTTTQLWSGSEFVAISDSSPAHLYAHLLVRDSSGNYNSAVHPGAAIAVLDSTPPRFAGTAALSASGSDKINVAWDAGITDGRGLYTAAVYYSQTPPASAAAADVESWKAAASTVTRAISNLASLAAPGNVEITGLVAGTTYYAYLCATDAAGNAGNFATTPPSVATEDDAPDTGTQLPFDAAGLTTLSHTDPRGVTYRVTRAPKNQIMTFSPYSAASDPTKNLDRYTLMIPVAAAQRYSSILEDRFRIYLHAGQHPQPQLQYNVPQLFYISTPNASYPVSGLQNHLDKYHVLSVSYDGTTVAFHLHMADGAAVFSGMTNATYGPQTSGLAISSLRFDVETDNADRIYYVAPPRVFARALSSAEIQAQAEDMLRAPLPTLSLVASVTASGGTPAGLFDNNFGWNANAWVVSGTDNHADISFVGPIRISRIRVFSLGQNGREHSMPTAIEVYGDPAGANTKIFEKTNVASTGQFLNTSDWVFVGAHATLGSTYQTYYLDLHVNASQAYRSVRFRMIGSTSQGFQDVLEMQIFGERQDLVPPGSQTIDFNVASASAFLAANADKFASPAIEGAGQPPSANLTFDPATKTLTMAGANLATAFVNLSGGEFTMIARFRSLNYTYLLDHNGVNQYYGIEGGNSLYRLNTALAPSSTEFRTLVMRGQGNTQYVDVFGQNGAAIVSRTATRTAYAKVAWWLSGAENIQLQKLVVSTTFVPNAEVTLYL